MRLIDADALEKAIHEWMPKDQETWMESEIPPIENLVVSIMMTIQEQPTMDVAEVQHGRWTKKEYAEEVNGYLIPNYECSQCGYWSREEYDYCPNCGAKMEE